MSQKLRGEDLLAYVRDNKGLPEKDLAVGAGYFTNNPDGSIQINTKPFYQELSIANGLVLPSTVGKTTSNGSTPGKRGKSLAYCLTSNYRTGSVVITGGYLTQIGVKPGQQISVEVVPEAGELVLKLSETQPEPQETEDEPDEMEDEEEDGEEVAAEPAYAIA
jgi:hypothetical protein